MSGSKLSRRKLLAYLKGHRLDELIVSVGTIEGPAKDGYKTVRSNGQFTFRLKTSKSR